MAVVDGLPGPEHDVVAKDTLIFSPDGKRVAYGAKTNNKWVVVVDGQPGPECDGIGTLVFSADGSRVAYAAEKGDRVVVMVDDQPGPEYHDLACGPVFQTAGEVEYLATNLEGGRHVLYRVTHPRR